MAVTAALYGRSVLHFGKGEIAYLGDSIKCALLGAAYTFDQDAHETFGDVVAQEVAGNGYTARGAALTGRSVAYTAADNKTRFFAEDSFWVPASGQSLTASKAVIYKDTGTNSTSWLIGFVDFGAAITATGAPLTINWHDTEGLFFLGVN
jgi:hypothetical protein